MLRASLAAADMTVITAIPRNVKDVTTTVASCHSDDQTPTISAIWCGVVDTGSRFYLIQGPKWTQMDTMAHTNLNSVFT